MDASQFHRRAVTASRAGRAGDAAEEIRRAVLIEPGNFFASADLAVLFGRASRAFAKTSWNNRLLTLNPLHVPSLRHIAETLSELGDWRRSSRAWRRVIVNDPGRSKDLLRLIIGVSKVGNTQSCLQYFQWANTIRASDAGTLFSWGTALFHGRLFAEAETKMREVLLSRAKDPKVHFWMGRILHAQSRKADAEPHFEIASRSSEDLRRAADMIRKTARASDYEIR